MRTRRAVESAVFAAAFLTVAVLVDHGVFHALDQHAVRHWMPWLSPGHHALITLAGLFVPRIVHGSVVGSIVDVWTYPASAFASGVLVLVAAVAVRGRTAVQLLALWVLVDVVELAGKLIVERPALTTADGTHVAPFDHSLPSGHTLRAFVVATALACTWGYGRLAFAWAVTVPFALVALGAHTPTDVVAGALAFGALATAIRPWEGSEGAAAGARAPGAGAGASRPPAR